ncbi:unnamed protein product [Arabis nemorensis]|uniref:Uncharacterized protein n=1 Tax=Arabis nemorensis TaxID=586526 RepID=A0A565BEE3_9BRAS|nr:unnamed protein product [Arabis nemorensis]
MKKIFTANLIRMVGSKRKRCSSRFLFAGVDGIDSVQLTILFAGVDALGGSSEALLHRSVFCRLEEVSRRFLHGFANLIPGSLKTHHTQATRPRQGRSAEATSGGGEKFIGVECFKPRSAF